MSSPKTQPHLILLSPDANRVAVLETIEQQGGRITHRFGHEALVIQLDQEEATVASWLPTGTRLLRDQDAIPASLSPSARKQLRAARRRHALAYRTAKEARRKGQPLKREWGTGGLPIPDLPQQNVELPLPGLHILEMPDLSEVIDAAADIVLPTNERLINDVAVGVVIVSGPGEYALSADEREYILTEVQEGLGWLGALEPAARVTWVYDVQEVTVNFTPWAGARWPGVPQEFYRAIDAALYREDNEKVYLFSGNRYARFHITNGKPVFEANRPIAGNWPSLPAEFEAGIDAALWRHSNGKIYLFKGSQYARFNPTNGLVLEAVRPIAGNWLGLPAEFEAGIDAALMDKNASKIYLFKGSQFVRFSNVAAGVDAGYPQPIANFCPRLPVGFTAQIDAAVQSGDGKIYLFKSAGDVGTYVQISDLTVGVDQGFELGQPVGLTNVETELLWREPAMAQLGYAPGDAGLKQFVYDLRAKLDTQWAYLGFYTKCPTTWGAYANKSPARIVVRYPNFIPPDQGGDWWLELVDQYIAHETAHLFGAVDEYVDCPCQCSDLAGAFFKHPNSNCFRCNPTVTEDCLMRNDQRTACEHTRWHLGWGAFMTKLDAAMWRGDNHKIYLFSHDQYIRFTNVSAGRDAGYPRQLAGHWPGLPQTFAQGIDAALYRPDNGKIYFFKGNQYARYTTANNQLTYEVTRYIADGWPGLPAEFQTGIDAAFWRESNAKVYFFKGNRYVRFKLVDSVPVYEYVRPIAGNWPGLPTSFENGIDAVLMRCSTHKIYFFKGRHYVRYLDAENCAESGLLHINTSWMPFPK